MNHKTVIKIIANIGLFVTAVIVFYGFVLYFIQRLNHPWYLAFLFIMYLLQLFVYWSLMRSVNDFTK